MPTMLYKCPGPHDIHGGRFDYVIVDESEIATAQADGWHLTTTEAKAASEKPADVPADDAPPTREELEQKARELGIKFDGRTGDKKLAALIAEKV